MALTKKLRTKTVKTERKREKNQEHSEKKHDRITWFSTKVPISTADNTLKA